MDDDGVLSRSDLSQYLMLVTGGNLEDDELNEIISEVFNEIGTTKEDSIKDSNKDSTKLVDDDKDTDEVVTYSEYRRVVATLDFQAKLFLPI